MGGGAGGYCGNVEGRRVSAIRIGVEMGRQRMPLVLAALMIVVALSGCGHSGPAPVYEGHGPAPDGYYRIRSGDTLHKIARRYKVSHKKLAQWNDLDPPFNIYAGALLRVESPTPKRSPKPTSRGDTRTAKATNPSTKRDGTAVKTAAATSARTRGGTVKTVSGLRWRWPVKGRIVQKYRGGDRTRQSIRIAGRPGQKVLAAEAGTVVYSGSGLKGYGNLIILKHNDKYLSAYGFNRRLLVNEGAKVKRGQDIAEIGQASGGGYLLHFEIRRNGSAVDPLKYLP